MPRPTTKSDLITLANENFTKLFTFVNSMSEEEQHRDFAFEDRDKNVRDVLIHLYEWHKLLLNFINSNKSGEFTPFLPAPYNWKTYPKMNVEIWRKHQNTPLKEAKILLTESHADVVNLIEKFSDEELFAKGVFAWTGNVTLGSYAVSATSSHYDWAMKKIRKHKRNL